MHTRICTALLTALLVLGLVTPATAQEAVEGEQPKELAPRVRADLVGAIDGIDWPRFLPERRFSSAAADTTLTRSAMRATSDEELGYARAGDPSSVVWDTCNDSDNTRLDLRGSMVVQRADQQGFLGYTCRPWATADLGRGAFVWGLYVPEYDDSPELEPVDPEDPDGPKLDPGPLPPRFPDFLVAAFLHQGVLETLVVRTPDPSQDSWYATWNAAAKRVDDHAFDVVVPTKSFGSPATFTYEWAVTDGRGGNDLFPEHYVVAVADTATFPNPCTGTYAGQVRATSSARVAHDAAGASWSLPAIGADERQRSTALVAVVDDGVSGGRSGFGDRVLTGYDAAFGAQMGTDSDRGGHGSAVASVLGAARAANAGMAGLDLGARILPVNVTDTDGCVDDEALAAGIDHAANAGAQVIIVSIAGPDSPLLRDAVDRAQRSGAVIVAPVGNGGSSSTVLFPAAHPGVIGVGATDVHGNVAGYTARGRGLDVLAPGGDGSGDPTRDVVAFWELHQLRAQHGTGISSGLVAGAVALYRSRYPSATVGEVRRALAASSLGTGVEGHDPDDGYGLLDLPRLLASAPGPDDARELLERIDAREPAQAAAMLSATRFPSRGSAPHAVLARTDLFADALAGAPLTATGPLLLTARTVLPETTAAALSYVLAPGAKIYLLGGTTAIDEGVAEELRRQGFVVHRLSGPSRIETSIAIAEEVRTLYGTDSGAVGIARAFGTANDETAAWADAVTGGAWAARTRTPLVVTTSDRVHPAIADALRRWAPTQTVLLGGTAALSDTVAMTVPGPRRVSGADRAATAVAIGGLWPVQTKGFTVVNGYTATGWAFGLSAAGLAAQTDRPLLMTNRYTLPPATESAVVARCGDQANVQLVGSSDFIAGSVENLLQEKATC